MTIGITCNTSGCTLFHGTNEKEIDLKHLLGNPGPWLIDGQVQGDLRYLADGRPDWQELQCLEEGAARAEVRFHETVVMLDIRQSIPRRLPIIQRDKALKKALESYPHETVIGTWQQPIEGTYPNSEEVLMHPEWMKPPAGERG